MREHFASYDHGKSTSVQATAAVYRDVIAHPIIARASYNHRLVSLERLNPWSVASLPTSSVRASAIVVDTAEIPVREDI